MPKITEFPAHTAPDANDVLPIVDLVANPDDTKKVTVADLLAKGTRSGSISLPPGAAIIPTGSGAMQVLFDGSTFDYILLDFDDSSLEVAFFQVTMPRDYDGGDIVFKIHWFAAATSGNVVWRVIWRKVAAGAVANGNFTGDSNSLVSAVAGTANQLVVGSTVATGSGAAVGDVLLIRLSRDGSHVSDTMSGDARVLGFELTYTGKAV